jgi:hypothetical protein
MTGGLSALLGRVGGWRGSDDGDPDPEPSATLYACPECDTTYIGRDKESCSRCGCAVDPIPDERDLGFGIDR